MVSYAEDLASVLEGSSFTIRAGERVGVRAKTGAGKSSLKLVLFRILETRESSI